MLRKIGMRAHDYGKTSIEELAEKVVNDQYGTIQLALVKAIAGVDKVEEGLNQDIANHIQKVLYKKCIGISVLGAYLNYGTSDDLQRAYNISIFNKHLDLAKSFGSRVVGTETGSLDIHYKSHPENHRDKGFNILRTSLEIMADTAKKNNVDMAIEPVSNHILNTSVITKEMVKKINTKNLKIIFDPVNIITPDNYKQQDYMIEEMFDLLGDLIVVVHGKDFVIQEGKKVIVSPGKGLLNYKLLTQQIIQSNNEIDLLAENNPVSELERVSGFFHSLYN